MSFIPAPDVSPLISQGVAVGSWREQQQHGGWCPGGVLGTGGLGARSVWPGCAAAAHPPRGQSGPGHREADDALLESMGFVEGNRPGEKINCTWDITLCVGLVLGDVQMVGKEAGLS